MPTQKLTSTNILELTSKLTNPSEILKVFHTDRSVSTQELSTIKKQNGKDAVLLQNSIDNGKLFSKEIVQQEMEKLDHEQKLFPFKRMLRTKDKVIMHIHEKMTESYKQKQFFRESRRSYISKIMEENLCEKVKELPHIPVMIESSHKPKKGIRFYIQSRREIFLLEYLIGVKKDEIQKIQDQMRLEEKNVTDTELQLEVDIQEFSNFLEDNDRKTVEAIQKAEEEMKRRLEKLEIIKSLNGKISELSSEISKHRENLREYYLYRQFLFSLSPLKWQKEVIRSMKERTSKNLPISQDSKMDVVKRKNELEENKKLQDSEEKPLFIEIPSIDTFEMWDNQFPDLAPELYFSNPEDILEILLNLEDQDLSLINMTLDMEEEIESTKMKFQESQEKLNEENEYLKNQIKLLENVTTIQKQKFEELEVQIKMLSVGHIKEIDHKKILETIGKKIEHVYERFIGRNEANISALQMLSSLEHKIDEILEVIENLPAEKIMVAERLRERELRTKMREEKEAVTKQMIEWKLERAAQRRKMANERHIGHRWVYRSPPPQLPHKSKKNVEDIDEDKEYAYFFT